MSRVDQSAHIILPCLESSLREITCSSKGTETGLGESLWELQPSKQTGQSRLQVTRVQERSEAKSRPDPTVCAPCRKSRVWSWQAEKAGLPDLGFLQRRFKVDQRLSAQVNSNFCPQEPAVKAASLSEYWDTILTHLQSHFY